CALAQLVEQPRVLDSDDGLGGEIRQQLDLLVSKRLNFLTREIDSSDQLILFEHRDRNYRPIATQLRGGNDEWIALNVSPRRRDVGDLRDLFRAGNSSSGRVGRRTDHWFPRARLDECGRGVVERYRAETVAIIRVESTEFGVADACRVLQYRLKHRFQLAGRA